MESVPSELELVLRVLLAAVLGGAVGYDRQVRQKPAGIRTHMLVAAGAALFFSAAVLILGDAAIADMRGDAVRVPAAIVTGVGFLGAGAILRYGERVRGLTTAAGIWVVAAIGLLSGAGFFIVAIGGTIIALVVVNITALIDERILGMRNGEQDDE